MKKEISYQTKKKDTKISKPKHKNLKERKPLTIKSSNVPTKEHLEELIKDFSQFLQDTYYS